jgi:hypothetical protein
MSHFSTIKTVIRDQVLLCDTLRHLHHNFQEGERVLIRGYQGNTAHGEVVVNTGSEYDIGFQRQEDETFAICSDWWGVQGNTQIKEAEFLRQVNQTYSHQTVRRQVELHGYIIEEERVLENGEIELVVAEPA